MCIRETSEKLLIGEKKKMTQYLELIAPWFEKQEMNRSGRNPGEYGRKLGLDLEESCHQKCSINRTRWENGMAKSCVGHDGGVRDSS